MNIKLETLTTLLEIVDGYIITNREVLDDGDIKRYDAAREELVDLINQVDNNKQ